MFKVTDLVTHSPDTGGDLSEATPASGFLTVAPLLPAVDKSPGKQGPGLGGGGWGGVTGRVKGHACVWGSETVLGPAFTGRRSGKVLRGCGCVGLGVSGQAERRDLGFRSERKVDVGKARDAQKGLSGPKGWRTGPG